MKKILIVATLLLAVGVFRVNAQQEPQLTHYMFNKLIYNPAYAGSRDNICATLLYHNQWSSFSGEDKEGAPITQTFSVDGPFSFKGQKLGAGLHIVNDAQGWERTTGVMGSFAYRKPLSFADVSVGLNIGYLQKGLNGTWRPKDPGDKEIPANAVNQGGLDAGFGVYLNNPLWYAGASVLHIPQMKFNWSGTGESQIIRTYYIQGGYNYVTPLPNLELQPGILIKNEAAIWQVSANLIALYDQRYWAGINYHSGDDIAMMLGINIFNFKVGYSFDLPMGENKIFGGKHEILVNYCFRISLDTEKNYHKSTRFL